MTEASVIIPNFNGIKYLRTVLDSLRAQTADSFETILVDNGSSDGSVDFVLTFYPEVKVIALDQNYGFSRAVNEGIRASGAPFVILLNNDTRTDPDFVKELLLAIRRHPKAFACQARMLRMQDENVLDGTGDLYCAAGWAIARGRGKSADCYTGEGQVFSCCAGAAVYRRSRMVKLGLFDTEHFAYLEDVDIGYRARICGLENWYAPRALVWHQGSGTTGSRYNEFKVRYSSRNNIYMIRKNMPALQILLNLPFLTAGFGLKFLYFLPKGYGLEYLAGIKNGLELPVGERKVRFRLKRLPAYARIQAELWANLFRIAR